MSDDEYGGGEVSRFEFFTWQVIIFVGVIILVVVAWPHLFN